MHGITVAGLRETFTLKGKSTPKCVSKRERKWSVFIFAVECSSGCTATIWYTRSYFLPFSLHFYPVSVDKLPDMWNLEGRKKGTKTRLASDKWWYDMAKIEEVSTSGIPQSAPWGVSCNKPHLKCFHTNAQSMRNQWVQSQSYILIPEIWHHWHKLSLVGWVLWLKCPVVW